MRGAALRYGVLTKMQQDLQKYAKKLRDDAKLQRKLDRIKAARQEAEAAAGKLPAPKRRPARHQKERKRKVRH